MLKSASDITADLQKVCLASAPSHEVVNHWMRLFPVEIPQLAIQEIATALDIASGNFSKILKHKLGYTKVYAQCRNSVGTYQETSSHATRQGPLGYGRLSPELLWTDPGLRSGMSVCDLIFTFTKNCWRVMNC